MTGLAFNSANLGAVEIMGMSANGAEYGFPNINVWAGVGMAAVALMFRTWVILRPVAVPPNSDSTAPEADSRTEQ